MGMTSLLKEKVMVFCASGRRDVFEGQGAEGFTDWGQVNRRHWVRMLRQDCGRPVLMELRVRAATLGHFCRLLPSSSACGLKPLWTWAAGGPCPFVVKRRRFSRAGFREA
jgi:hypothetical protein